MTHITLSRATNSKPCLEYFSDGSGEARRVTIDACPFRIGRAESANLRVESVQVSREHAEIVERNGVWLIRDLGSTNGTHVNGKQIKENLLSDGDILRIAETELTFIASAASQFQRMVTQPIRSRQLSTATNEIAPEVAAARALIEATLHQVIPVRVLAAVSLRHGIAEALFAPANHCPNLQLALDHSHPTGTHYRELERRRAVVAAAARAESRRLYLAVSRAEIDTPRRLFAALRQLRSQTPSDWELGATISLPTDFDAMRITELYREAQDNDLRFAFDDFQGTGAQVLQLKAVLPDYLVLSPQMTSNLTATRQPVRRLESLLSACEELAIKPVLPRLDSADAIALCRDIGFDLVLEPRPAHRARPQIEAVSSTPGHSAVFA